MIKANRENLMEHARALLGNEYSPDAAATLISEALTGLVRSPYRHISHDRAEHLDRLSDIMHAYGVEGILEGSVDIQYVNQGDTYAMTLLYCDNELQISSWGDIVENRGDIAENS